MRPAASGLQKSYLTDCWSHWSVHWCNAAQQLRVNLEYGVKYVSETCPSYCSQLKQTSPADVQLLPMAIVLVQAGKKQIQG